MENLSPSRWYRTNYDNPHNAVPVVDVHQLAELLPHGSGIDGNWRIVARKNGDLVVYGEYHAMNEHGMYCGWRNFRFTIVRVKRDVRNPLCGPCLGKTQIVHRAGDIILDVFVGGGDAKDYLYDSVYWAVRSLLTDSRHEHEPSTPAELEAVQTRS